MKPQWKVGASREFPVQSFGSWDGSKAEDQIFAWDFDKAKQCFLVYDVNKSENKTAYKFPFCYIVDGQPIAAREGLIAAKQRLPQGDVPVSVKEEMRSVIRHYEVKYLEMSKLVQRAVERVESLEPLTERDWTWHPMRAAYLETWNPTRDLDVIYRWAYLNKVDLDELLSVV